MVHYALDSTLLLQMPNGDTGETAIDFQTLDEDALADEAEGRDFLDYAVKCRLVEGYSVDSLVLDLSLGPLLFLCGFTAAR